MRVRSQVKQTSEVKSMRETDYTKEMIGGRGEF